MSATSPPEQPLDDIADTAEQLAPLVCADGCAWYHGFYPRLHALGLAATPDRHAGFFRDALRARARAGDERVLVSGMADAGMLFHLLDAYGETPLDVTLLDRCDTPLMLGVWAAHTRGSPVTTQCSDVLAYRTPAPLRASLALDIAASSSSLVRCSSGSDSASRKRVS